MEFPRFIVQMAAAVLFGQKAVTAFEQAKQENSDGGDRLTIEEVLDFGSLACGNLATLAGREKVIDLSSLPTREQIHAKLTAAGFTVIDGRRT